MKRYLVGGAVRDRLLGIPPRERDWLVTGADAGTLCARGYRRVGRDFPVFLHPQSGEEHALPRGGSEHTGARERIEADLRLRDLTINAIAEGEDGALIDPLGGHRDLEQRILRHAPGFSDDPVRVLRLARFAARYEHLGFRVAEETRALIRRMAGDGALQDLVPERVWSEIERALGGPRPRIFFDTLRACGALRPLLPELDRLYGVAQPPQHHPEIDCGEHTMLVLEQACRLDESRQTRFAALVHDLGKADTPREILPRHIGHEQRGVWRVTELCARLRIPNDYRDLAVAVARFHGQAHKALELRPATLLHLILGLDGLRNPTRFEWFVLACEADSRGRKGFGQRPYPQAGFLRRMRAAAVTVDAGALAAARPDDLPGDIKRARVEAIRRARQAWSAP
ncbi:MAG: multifunctional CCA addition/repair protein [Candidatus Sedimenticola endophacoides]